MLVTVIDPDGMGPSMKMLDSDTKDKACSPVAGCRCHSELSLRLADKRFVPFPVVYLVIERNDVGGRNPGQKHQHKRCYDRKTKPCYAKCLPCITKRDQSAHVFSLLSVGPGILNLSRDSLQNSAHGPSLIASHFRYARDNTTGKASLDVPIRQPLTV